MRRLDISSRSHRDGDRDVLVNPMKFTNFAIIPLSYKSALALQEAKARGGEVGEFGCMSGIGTYSENNDIIPDHVENQSWKEDTSRTS